MFAGVRQSIEHEIHHMLIGKGVVNVLAAPLAKNKVLAAKNPQTLRDRRDALAFRLGQFGYASLAPRRSP
jgi:hypothetical protein